MKRRFTVPAWGRTIAAYSACQVIAKGIGLALVGVQIVGLTPEAFAGFVIALVIGSAISQFVGLGAQRVIGRLAAAPPEDAIAMDARARAAVTRFRWQTIASLLLCAALVVLGYGLRSKSIEYVAACVFFGAVAAANQMTDAAQVGRGAYLRAGLGAIAFNVAALASLGVALAMHVHVDATLMTWLYAFSGVIGAVAIGMPAWDRQGSADPSDLTSDMWDGVSLAWLGLLMLAYFRMDVIIGSALFPLKEFAVYVTAYRLIEVGVGLSQVLALASRRLLAQSVITAGVDTLRRNLFAVMGSGAAASLVLLVGAALGAQLYPTLMRPSVFAALTILLGVGPAAATQAWALSALGVGVRGGVARRNVIITSGIGIALAAAMLVIGKHLDGLTGFTRADVLGEALVAWLMAVVFFRDAAGARFGLVGALPIAIAAATSVPGDGRILAVGLTVALGIAVASFRRIGRNRPAVAGPTADAGESYVSAESAGAATAERSAGDPS